MNKKLIAIAIATAMAAPVAMADVKLSGRVSYQYTNVDTDTAAEDVRSLNDDNGHGRIQFDATSGNVFGRVARNTSALGFSAREQYIGYKLDGGKSLQFGRGNTYSGSSPTGLAAVLDIAKPGDNLLITSFGSGAGSDSFIFKVTDLLPERRKTGRTVRSMLDGPVRYLDYGEYASYREKIILND